MERLSFIRRPDAAGREPVSDEARQDVAMIDAALADEASRRVAEVALSVAAELVWHAKCSARLQRRLGSGQDAGSAALSDEALAEVLDAANLPDMLHRRAMLIAQAVSVPTAAGIIGVSPGTIRVRLRKGTLIGIRQSGKRPWRIPSFQFTREGELPYLSRVLKSTSCPVAPETWHEIMKTPHDDLDGQCPCNWLAAGEDHVPVQRIVVERFGP